MNCWELLAIYVAGMLVTGFVFGVGCQGELDADDGAYFAAAVSLWPIFLPIFLAIMAFEAGGRIKRRREKP